MAGLVTTGVGASFVAVAFRVGRARISPENRLGRNAHATWWSCLGAYLIVQGVLTVAAGLDRGIADAYVASRIITIPLLCAAVWGISTYLLHLYTGNRGYASALAVVYVLVACLFYYVTFAAGVPQLQEERWIIGYDDSAPLYRLVYVLVGLPPIVTSLAFLALAPRVQNPLQRYRIVLGGGSILMYVGMGLLARLTAPDVVVFATLVPLGAIAGVTAVLAQYPPAAWAVRLGVAGHQPTRTPPLDNGRLERQAALAHRLRELI